MEKLNPQLLAQLLAIARGQGGASYDPSLEGFTVDTRRDVIGRTGGGGDASTEIYGDPITRLYQQTGHETWGQDTANVFDAQGNYIGPSSGDSEALSLAKFLAASVGGYYGANALNGAMGGAAGAAGAGEAAGGSALDALLAGGGYGADAGTLVGGSALTSGGTSALGTTLADAGIMSAAGGGGLGTLGTAAGAAGSLGSIGSAGSTASTLSNMADAAKTASSGLNLGGLLGAAAGALSSKDQQQTTSRDPWAPAQPMLKGLIDQLPALQQQYAQHPFNGAQMAGYNNMAGLLDLVNKNAGGLLSGFQANASGANQFQRGNPRGLIGSSFNPTAQEWNPQSYGRFGG